MTKQEVGPEKKRPLRQLLQSASFYFGAAAPNTSDGSEDAGNMDQPEKDSRDECNRAGSEPA